MTALAQSRGTKELWKRIVGYANAEFSVTNQSAQGRQFLALLQACIRWINPTIGMFAAAMPEVFSKGIEDATNEGTPISAAAMKYQADIKRVLSWVVEPDRADPKVAEGAFEFLRTNVESIRWERLFNDKFPPTRRNAAFWVEAPMNFGHVTSPICEFLWRQMERYRNGDGELERLIPIGICGRPSCGRFFPIERIGRGKYCCDNCRAVHWQETHPEERRERVEERRRLSKDRDQKVLEIARTGLRKAKK